VDRQHVGRRSTRIGFVLALAFLTITGRLWQLQILDRSHYVALAEQDYLRSVSIPAPRGDIVSSDGVVLAGNKPAWELEYLNPQAGPLPARPRSCRHRPAPRHHPRPASPHGTPGGTPAAALLSGRPGPGPTAYSGAAHPIRGESPRLS